MELARRFYQMVSLPLVDLGRRTHALRLYGQLERWQWEGRGRQVEAQAGRTAELLAHAGRTCPYYRQLYRRCDFDPSRYTNPAELRALPLLNKALIRENFEGIKSAECDRFRPRLTRTGGSTGEPLTACHDAASHSHLIATNWLGWNAAGYVPGDPYLMLAGGTLIPSQRPLVHWLYFRMQRAHHVPAYHLSEEVLDRCVALLGGRRIHYLYGYSSTVSLLAEYCAGKKHSDFSLRGIFTTSDMLLRAQRERIERSLGAPVFDIYGCPESGLMSFECPRHEGYHYGMFGALVEITDDAGQPVPEGQVGKVIVTSLLNQAFPMIRYDTGDLASLSTIPCACGRGYDRILTLAGRQRDIIYTPDGRRIPGAFFNHLASLYAAPWLRRYQIVQEEDGQLILRLECREPPTAADLQVIEREIRAGLGVQMRLTLQRVAAIELTRMGKYKLIEQRMTAPRTASA